MRSKEIDYGKFNPPVWECVAFQNFLLVREHLERLLEVRRLREEIDPEMRYSITFDAAGEVVRGADGKPKRGHPAGEEPSVEMKSYLIRESTAEGRFSVEPLRAPV